jgi:hypothetical protein
MMLVCMIWACAAAGACINEMYVSSNIQIIFDAHLRKIYPFFLLNVTESLERGKNSLLANSREDLSIDTAFYHC